jgi:DNA-binding CsgD family transcriptional regulator
MRMDLIDDNMRAAISRLTSAERECLRRCLSHQTAKQMALDLGISPHAVEKRLKMARAKLGLSSSLQAAKLVEAVDGAGQVVPLPSDLPPAGAQPDQASSVAASRDDIVVIVRRQPFPLIIGVMLMSFLAAAGLMLALQSSGATDGRLLAPVRAAPALSLDTAARPTAGTEDALRYLVAGLASGSPDYAKLNPMFATVVRRDLPVTGPMFRGFGELKSMTYRGRGPMGDDAYDLVFAEGEVFMSAALDPEGRMAGGFLRPGGAPTQ